MTITVLPFPDLPYEDFDLEPINTQEISPMEDRGHESVDFGTPYWSLTTARTPWLTDSEIDLADAFLQEASIGMTVFECHDVYRPRPAAYGKSPLSGVKAGGGAFDGSAVLNAITDIGGALFGAGTLAASIAGSVISAGLALGARLALSYNNRPKPQAQTAIRGSVRVGAGLDCAILMGEDKVKGHLQYYAKWGAGNGRNAYVKKLADGWCEGLAPYVYVFGERVDLIEQDTVGNEAARYTLDGWGNAIVLRFYDGRPGQLADSELVAATAGMETPWRATSRGTNITYVVEDQTYSAGAFASGLPEITYVLRGLREYDPRKDSTVPGGSGPHRLDDRSTWEFTQNNAVHRINYLIGHSGALSGEVMVGVGKQVSEIDLAMHMVAANVCDAERVVGGRTIPTYHCNQWASAGDDHLAVLKNIEDAMAGYAVNAAGLDGVLAGAQQIPAGEITSSDIRTDDAVTGKNRRSSREGFNVLSGQYSAKETGFEPEGLKTVTVNADVEFDGRKRSASNDFLQVSDPDIAQYLLNIRYRQNRKAKVRQLPVSRRLGYAVRLGEWWTFEGIDWLIVRRGIDKRGRITLGLAETGADIYDEEGIEAGPVVLPKPAPINPSLISTVSNFAVAAGLVEGNNGAQVPALVFTWDDPEDPTVTEIRIEYREAGTTEPLFSAVAPDPAAGMLTVTAGVLSGKNYESRATIRTVPDRLKTFTSWVTTEVATQPVQVALNEVTQGIYGLLATLRQQADELQATIELAGGNAAIDTADQYLKRERIKRTVGALSAAVTTETQARIDGQTALAATLTQVEAKANDATSSGLVKWETSAGPGGDVLARFTVFGRATAGGTYRDGGAVLDVTDTGATWSFFSDKFNILKPDGTAIAVFGLDGSDLVIQNIRVGTVQFDQLSSANGKLVIKGSGSNASIEIFS